MADAVAPPAVAQAPPVVAGFTTPSPAAGQKRTETLKVPLPEATGNEVVDEDNNGKHGIMMNMFKDVMHDRDFIIPLFRKLQELQKQKAKQVDSPLETFSKISSVGKSCPDFLVFHLSRVSDMTIEDIMKCRRQDDEVINQLITYDTQIHVNLKLPKQCFVKDFYQHFLKSRSKECGSRLTSWKRAGGITANNTLDWSKGCYRLEFNGKGGLLRKIIHPATKEEAIVKPEYHINDSWVLLNNWSDADAALQLKPMPAVKLSTFFASDQGPNKVHNFGCRAAEFAKYIGEQYSKWEEERQKDTSTGSVDLQKAASSLKNIEQEKKKENLKRAQASAIEKVKGKKQRAAISLKSS